tara:strand:+ start:1363 stop:1569 length:207 start_codon:yes stop_codon:yes gene_type:complete
MARATRRETHARRVDDTWALRARNATFSMKDVADKEHGRRAIHFISFIHARASLGGAVGWESRRFTDG